MTCGLLFVVRVLLFVCLLLSGDGGCCLVLFVVLGLVLVIGC